AESVANPIPTSLETLLQLTPDAGRRALGRLCGTDEPPTLVGAKDVVPAGAAELIVVGAGLADPRSAIEGVGGVLPERSCDPHQDLGAAVLVRLDRAAAGLSVAAHHDRRWRFRHVPPRDAGHERLGPDSVRDLP